MLKDILENKKKEIEESKKSLPFSELKKRLVDFNEEIRDFKKVLLDNARKTTNLYIA